VVVVGSDGLDAEFGSVAGEIAPTRQPLLVRSRVFFGSWWCGGVLYII
jgi:hypothetical protein